MWKRRRSAGNERVRQRCRARRLQVGIEALEDRRLLTVATVDTAFRADNFALDTRFSYDFRRTTDIVDYHDTIAGGRLTIGNASQPFAGSIQYDSPTTGTGSFTGKFAGAGEDFFDGFTCSQYTVEHTGSMSFTDDNGVLSITNATPTSSTFTNYSDLFGGFCPPPDPAATFSPFVTPTENYSGSIQQDTGLVTLLANGQTEGGTQAITSIGNIQWEDSATADLSVSYSINNDGQIVIETTETGLPLPSSGKERSEPLTNVRLYFTEIANRFLTLDSVPLEESTEIYWNTESVTITLDSVNPPPPNANFLMAIVDEQNTVAEDPTNNYVFIPLGDVPITPFDFGDAARPVSPTLNNYPTTLADDGARHIVGSGLKLGASVDQELVANPNTFANGDDTAGSDDEDGVRFSSTLLAAPVSTTSSVVVTASSAAKLDAWIDFNQDGDWDDSGEQIFTTRSVNAGENLLPFRVPANATHGETYARFRLSSTGGLQPRGIAVDGEVEDYTVSLLGHLLNESIVISPPAGETIFVNEGSSYVLHQDGIELFRAPPSVVDGIVVEGTDGDDTLVLGNVFTSNGPIVPLSFQAIGGGTDSITPFLFHQDLDLTVLPPQTFVGVEEIDLRGTGSNDLTINRSVVLNVTDIDNTLRLSYQDEDNVDFGGAWRSDPNEIVNSVFYQWLRSSGVKIRVQNDAHWQNPVNRFDVNGDTQVTLLDALTVVNKMHQGLGGELPARSSANLDEPNVDVTGKDASGKAELTLLDVVAVINEINRNRADTTSPSTSVRSTGGSNTSGNGSSNSSGNSGNSAPDQTATTTRRGTPPRGIVSHVDPDDAHTDNPHVFVDNSANSDVDDFFTNLGL